MHLHQNIIYLRDNIQYLGVKICQKIHTFEDNISVVEITTHIHTKLHKGHNTLNFLQVKETSVSRTIAFHHSDGENNKADIQ